MLQVRNLNKTYIVKHHPFKALNDVSVEVNRGEVFGFIGLSGAGKTSLARCISGLEKADSGEIYICGEDITKLKGAKMRAARKKMGLVFQHFNLLMNATVYDNIAFPLRISNNSKAFIASRVTEMLELVGLTDKRNAYPATLSGGQKQRVGIARALAAAPELVICDEATSALDPDTTRSILALIKRINVETGVTFVVITHEMDVIKEICSHVAVMEGGEIIERGPVLTVLTQPQTATARRFFAREQWDENWLNQGRGKICRAVFVGDVARDSFISDVSRQFDIGLSILAGHIESISGTTVGSLILEINGTDEVINGALQYFTAHGVGIEVLS